MSRPDYSDDQRRRMHEQNRRSWNVVTPAHNSHKTDQASFLHDGGSTLFSEETELLGDAQGLRIAHLQCNCGQDTLSLAGLGADVVGVDIADEPISFARRLSEESGIPARFERADVLEWLHETDARFDVAFTTYGGVGWLCDLNRWARGVARILEPGGRLVFLEFHPLIWSIGADGRLVEPYFIEDVLEESGVSDYVGAELAPSGYLEGEPDFVNSERSFSFQWTVADIVQAVVDAGLMIETLREYPFANGAMVIDGMQPLPQRRYGPPPGVPAMPLMLGLTARRP